MTTLTISKSHSFLQSLSARFVRAAGFRAFGVALAFAALVLLSAKESRADQFVLFDATGLPSP